MLASKLWGSDRKLREMEVQASIAQAAVEERRQEREAYLTALQAMVQVSAEASKAHAANAAALQTFLEGFKVSEKPKSRVVDEAEDFENYLKAKGHKKDAIDAALADYNLILNDDFSR
jgi:hypothetical protein